MSGFTRSSRRDGDIPYDAPMEAIHETRRTEVKDVHLYW